MLLTICQKQWWFYIVLVRNTRKILEHSRRGILLPNQCSRIGWEGGTCRRSGRSRRHTDNLLHRWSAASGKPAGRGRSRWVGREGCTRSSGCLQDRVWLQDMTARCQAQNFAAAYAFVKETITHDRRCYSSSWRWRRRSGMPGRTPPHCHRVWNPCRRTRTCRTRKFPGKVWGPPERGRAWSGRTWWHQRTWLCTVAAHYRCSQGECPDGCLADSWRGRQSIICVSCVDDVMLTWVFEHRIESSGDQWSLVC